MKYLLSIIFFLLSFISYGQITVNLSSPYDAPTFLIDDVLFSGRSVRAALTAIQSYGRPLNVELLVLIDRRFSRHLPIQPTYKGRQVDAINEEKVIVHWKELHSKDAIYIDNK